MHVAGPYAVSGVCLIASVLVARYSFWLSFAFLCFAIQGPFSAQAAFWASVSETTPKPVLGAVLGIINAIGNIGGWAGNAAFGWLKEETHGTAVPFSTLGAGMLVAAVLCFLIRKPRPVASHTTEPEANAV